MNEGGCSFLTVNAAAAPFCRARGDSPEFASGIDKFFIALPDFGDHAAAPQFRGQAGRRTARVESDESVALNT